MHNVDPIKKQKLSLAQKYKLYLINSPKSKDKLSNKYNLLDDLNTTDKAMMKALKSYIRKR